MKVEVSIGEAIDKLSILELKLLKIPDETKKIEIQKEIDELNECQQYKSTYGFYYNILMYVNEKIWDLTDVVKSINANDEKFATISNQIFEFNQKRFRVKTWFNLLIDSNIKEQKSYAQTHCKIIIDDKDYVHYEDYFIDKMSEIVYLCLNYDVITFETPGISVIQEIIKIIKIPTIIFDEEMKTRLNIPKNIYLSEFNIPGDELYDVFNSNSYSNTNSINYIIGGMFGDFIQTLSVVCENFHKFGRKGVLYISERGDAFRNGLKNTYNDTYHVIMAQTYIQDFKIYNGEHIDVDLTSWRSYPKLFIQNWYYTYKQCYDVEWGKCKWLEAPYDEKWKDKIVINTTHYRWPNNIDFALLKKLYTDDLIFISSDKNQHNYFVSMTQINVEYYEFKNFLDLTTIIGSCKLFVGSLSGPLSIANAMHKNRICGLVSYMDDLLNIRTENIMNIGLETILPNMRMTV